MTFEDKLKQAYKYIDLLCKENQEKEDIKQDVALYLWEHQDEDIKTVCREIKNKRLGDEYKHQRMRAKSIYNDDGECVDDDIYFVDERTVEYNEEKSPVTDEQREKVYKLEECLQTIDKIASSYFYSFMDGKIKRDTGRKLISYQARQKGNTKWILKGLTRNYLNNWSGYQNLLYQKMNWQKRSKDQRQWLC